MKKHKDAGKGNLLDGSRRPHLAIIGGHGPAATAQAMGLTIAALAENTTEDHDHPLISALAWALAPLDFQGRGDAQALQAEAERLAMQAQALGAWLVLPACNTTAPLLEAQLEARRIKCISLFEEPARAMRRKLREGASVLVLQSRGSREHGRHAQALRAVGLKPADPTAAQQFEVDAMIRMAVDPRDREQGRELLEMTLRGHPADGCVLGCSELSLLTAGLEARTPVIDGLLAAAEAVPRRLAKLAEQLEVVA